MAYRIRRAPHAVEEGKTPAVRCILRRRYQIGGARDDNTPNDTERSDYAMGWLTEFLREAYPPRPNYTIYLRIGSYWQYQSPIAPIYSPHAGARRPTS